MTCKCAVCGRENVVFGAIIGIDFASESGVIKDSIRSILCIDCAVSVSKKIKEIEDDYS